MGPHAGSGYRTLSDTRFPPRKGTSGELGKPLVFCALGTGDEHLKLAVIRERKGVAEPRTHGGRCEVLEMRAWRTEVHGCRCRRVHWRTAAAPLPRARIIGPKVTIQSDPTVTSSPVTYRLQQQRSAPHQKGPGARCIHRRDALVVRRRRRMVYRR